MPHICVKKVAIHCGGLLDITFSFCCGGGLMQSKQWQWKLIFEEETVAAEYGEG